MGWKRSGWNRSSTGKKKKGRGRSRDWLEEERFQFGAQAVSRRHVLSDRELFADNAARTLERFVLAHAKKGGFEQKLESLAKAACSFKTIYLDFDAIAQAWANRKATEIIQQKTVFALKQGTGKTFAVEGCMDSATAFVAAARALAAIETVPAKVFFVRWGEHSMARVEFEGKSVLFDLSFGRLLEIRPRLAERISSAIALGKYAETQEGPRALGLAALLRDFYKYSKKT